jgi:hypothetical protein
VLSYIETFKGIHNGDLVWQLSFGSGFKCNSAVWRARRSFKVHCGGVPNVVWEKINQSGYVHHCLLYNPQHQHSVHPW